MKYRFLRRDYLLPLLIMPVLQYAAFWAVGHWVLDDFGSRLPDYLGIAAFSAAVGFLWIYGSIYDNPMISAITIIAVAIYSIVMPFFGTYGDLGSAIWSGISALILLFGLTLVVSWVNKMVLQGFGWWLKFDKDFFYSPYLDIEEEAGWS